MMRLDKFIKMSRLIKRRTLASELCKLGGVLLNGRVAKASSTVKPNDELELHFGNRTVKARVLELPLRPAGNLTEAAQYVDIHFQERQTEARALPDDDE
jgi:ribosomal 50S subunit-recycling heat shock protein